MPINPIIFPITYQCNLNCKYCCLKDKHDEPKINKCLKLIEESDCDWVWITGGEPLLCDKLQKTCEDIKALGKMVGLTTNGTIENYDIVNYCDRVGVSIDGDKLYHDKYRDSSFDQAIAFLTSLVGQVETVMMFTQFIENRHCLKFIKKKAAELNVDYLQITPGVKK